MTGTRERISEPVKIKMVVESSAVMNPKKKNDWLFIKLFT